VYVVLFLKLIFTCR